MFSYFFPWLLLILLFSCDINQNQKFEFRGNALGTTYSINYFSKSEKNIQSGFDSIFEVINHSMSTYLESSLISRLNSGEDVKLDQHFRKVFLRSKEIYKITNGYFDPSIGILVNAYGFGPVEYDIDLNEKNIDSLMNYVGLDKFELVDDQMKVKPKQFYLDFNAIAKGYAVDVLADYIESQDISDYFVELGGEIVASGLNVDSGQAWRFGIEKPVDHNEERSLSFVIELNKRALATSGNYRKFRVDSLTGKKFVHTINSKTGLAGKSDVLSASVIAEDCMTADAYATAFMAMGFEQAKALILNEKISALLIYVDSDNNIRSFMTKDLKNQISEI
jgi:thiamine biosynthesis lipoprotein